MGDLGRRGRARDRQAIAARHQRDAELAFDLVEMRVAFAIEQGQQQIVVEFDLAAPASRQVGDEIARRGAHCAASSKPPIMPVRLLDRTPTIWTGRILPMASGAVLAWTGCRYGLRPISCPSWRPG